MSRYSVADEFGAVTSFTGRLLAEDHTDDPDRDKPQFVNVTVWRTDGGTYVLRRVRHYRIVHARKDCERGIQQGAEFRPATVEDTWPCSNCNPDLHLRRFGQQEQATLTIHPTAEDLIRALATHHHNTGAKDHHSRFARALLADISDTDPDIAGAWMEREIS